MKKIPKIANFYWDDSPLSLLNLLTLRSFKQLNSDWVLNLYKPKYRFNDITWECLNQKESYNNKNYLKYIDNYCDNTFSIDFRDIGFYNDVSEVYKSDFLRWYLLSTEGGLWSDMDVLYLKPINELKYEKNIIIGDDNGLDLTIFEEIGSNYANYLIGFLLASKNNTFYKNILNNAISSFNDKEYQSIGNKLIRKLYPEILDITFFHNDLNICKLPLDVVYPYDYRNLELLYYGDNIDLLTDNSIGIHWYNAHKVTKEYCNNLDLNNLKNSMMDNILKKINIKDEIK